MDYPLAKNANSVGFQSDVFMVQKGFYLILCKTSKIDFSRFIVTIYYMEIQGLQGMTGDYKGLQEVTRGYSRLQRITEKLFSNKNVPRYFFLVYFE